MTPLGMKAVNVRYFLIRIIVRKEMSSTSRLDAFEAPNDSEALVNASGILEEDLPNVLACTILKVHLYTYPIPTSL